MTPYLVYDVFTGTPFAGNPLGIVHGAQDLSSDTMQSVAREFGFSETVFVLPPTRGGDAGLRIFTPTQEIPFAGHPLVGTAVALADLGHGETLALDLPHITVEATITAHGAAIEIEAAFEVLHRPDPSLVAACLGLPPDGIREAVVASAGLPFCLTELTEAAALAGCAPVIDRFREAQVRYPLPFDFAIYAWTGGPGSIRARMFAPLDDIPEDPATGSAAVALALWRRHVTGAEQSLEIRQGEDMGRPSRIGVVTKGDRLVLSGRAVRVMEGHLYT